MRASRSLVTRPWAESFIRDVREEGYEEAQAARAEEDDSEALIAELGEALDGLVRANKALMAKIDILEKDCKRLQAEWLSRVSRADAENECRVSAARMKRLAAGLAEADGPTALSEAIYGIPIPPNKFQ